MAVTVWITAPCSREVCAFPPPVSVLRPAAERWRSAGHSAQRPHLRGCPVGPAKALCGLGVSALSSSLAQTVFTYVPSTPGRCPVGTCLTFPLVTTHGGVSVRSSDLPPGRGPARSTRPARAFPSASCPPGPWPPAHPGLSAEARVPGGPCPFRPPCPCCPRPRPRPGRTALAGALWPGLPDADRGSCLALGRAGARFLPRSTGVGFSESCSPLSATTLLSCHFVPLPAGLWNVPSHLESPLESAPPCPRGCDAPCESALRGRKAGG